MAGARLGSHACGAALIGLKLFIAKLRRGRGDRCVTVPTLTCDRRRTVRSWYLPASLRTPAHSCLDWYAGHLPAWWCCCCRCRYKGVDGTACHCCTLPGSYAGPSFPWFLRRLRGVGSLHDVIGVPHDKYVPECFLWRHPVGVVEGVSDHGSVGMLVLSRDHG